MRTAFDFSPLYRSSIGFDRIFHLLENAGRPQVAESWPPYDIARTGEDAYRVTIAVAGFAEDDLDIVHEPNLLIVSGQHKQEDGDGECLHRGLAAQSFSRGFELADHVRVTNASLENGLLTIDLVRELPEEMKPRRIAIATGEAAPRTARIEAKKQAA